VAERRRALALGIALCLAPGTALHAQNADSVQTLRAGDALNRIRRYTTSDVATARAIADSLVRVLPAEASVMPEALFAKASIAASAADAEADYSRIVNEYRFATKVPDALMRLALLEGARSNRAGALRHLDRLLRDHSESAVRSRASLMAGRLRLEMNDPARGCELLAAAWASAGLTERDVKDQAESLGAKCPGSVADRAQRDPSPLGILRAPKDSVPSAAMLGTAPTAAARRRQRDSVLAAQAARTAARRDSVTKAAAVAAPAAKPPTAVVRRDSVPNAAPPVVVRRDSAPVPRRPAPVAPTTETASTAPAGIRYAVQFAAYNDRPGAEQFAETLRRRGIAARVEGTDKPFRVRAGRFTTREEAEATLQLWKKPGQAAIVVSYP
jgi:cell division septation protein DedD